MLYCIKSDYLLGYRFEDREEPRPFAGRLPLAAGLPLLPDFLLSPKGRLPLEPVGFDDSFDFDEVSVRGFFRGDLRDFLAAVLSSEEESFIDFSKMDNSFGVK